MLALPLCTQPALQKWQVYFPARAPHNTLAGVFASSAADDEIFRADKQHSAPITSRNFSSFHTEQGGPIAHMSRAPTADAVGLRHAYADAGCCLRLHQYHLPLLV